jgi:hypothetical protein
MHRDDHVKSVDAFVAARDFLLAHRDDYESAYRGFRTRDMNTRSPLEFWEEDL